MANHEQFGELANTPGLNRLQATYVRAAAGEDAFALHMPGAHAGLPPGLAATGYPDTGR